MVKPPYVEVKKLSVNFLDGQAKRDELTLLPFVIIHLKPKACLSPLVRCQDLTYDVEQKLSRYRDLHVVPFPMIHLPLQMLEVQYQGRLSSE